MDDTSIPDDIRSALQELKGKLLEIYGGRLREMCVYGSYARGEQNQSSDVDILVRLEGDVRTGREISRVGPVASEISLKHDLLIAVFPVSESRYQSHRSPFLQALRHEAVAV